MKQFLIVLFLLAFAVSAHAQPASVQTDQNNGFIPLATYTWTIAADETLDLTDVLGYDNCGTNIPKGFKFRVYGGDLMLAPKDVEATGTYRIGEYVASGTVFPGWTGIKKPSSGSYNWVIAPMGSEVVVTFWMW